MEVLALPTLAGPVDHAAEANWRVTVGRAPKHTLLIASTQTEKQNATARCVGVAFGFASAYNCSMCKLKNMTETLTITL